MGISIIQPQRQSSYTPTKQSNDNSLWGSLGGMALGAGAALTALPTGGATLAALPLVLGAAGAGGTAGGAIGGLMDKSNNDKPGTTSYQNTPTQIPVGGSAVSRSMAANDPGQSHLEMLGSSLESLGRSNNPSLKQLAGPPLFQAYQMAHEQQYGPRQGVV